MAEDTDKWSSINPKCGVWESICVDSSELNILAKGNGKLEIQIGHNLGRQEFIKEGFRRRFDKQYEFSHTISCREVEVIPVSTPEFCSIDHDEFPVIHLKMKVLPNKVYFFSK